MEESLYGLPAISVFLYFQHLGKGDASYKRIELALDVSGIM
jgi:hypothetical protein